ncbi:MAG: hypothetical protein B9S37_10785 [Verrucomicrobiia bacterium Tous-C3TDCM]|nr:MAG: hypothetical protein B9S37_10785 [Verrucomicrobiae bacterium Tous-C3TDCM]
MTADSVFNISIGSNKTDNNITKVISNLIPKDVHKQQYYTFHASPIILLRNPDHLLPETSSEECLYAQSGKNIPLFSIKSSSLQKFSDLYSGFLEKSSDAESALIQAIHSLGGKSFEKGEVAIANYPNINWKEISNAAIVCAPDWPEKESAEFMQSLFFGRYLGDETGLFLNILHP